MPRQYRTFSFEDYEITNSGDVINKHTGRRVKGQKNGKGYLRVSIGGKLRFVHRMVAELYVPNPENKPQVNHKDGDKLNNSAANLEWVSNQENRDHAVKTGLQLQGEKCPWTKLTEKQVAFVRKYRTIGSKEMASVLGVSPSHIREIRRNESWKC